MAHSSLLSPIDFGADGDRDKEGEGEPDTGELGGNKAASESKIPGVAWGSESADTTDDDALADVTCGSKGVDTPAGVFVSAGERPVGEGAEAADGSGRGDPALPCLNFD